MSDGSSSDTARISVVGEVARRDSVYEDEKDEDENFGGALQNQGISGSSMGLTAGTVQPSGIKAFFKARQTTSEVSDRTTRSTEDRGEGSSSVRSPSWSSKGP